MRSKNIFCNLPSVSGRVIPDECSQNQPQVSGRIIQIVYQNQPINPFFPVRQFCQYMLQINVRMAQRFPAL